MMSHVLILALTLLPSFAQAEFSLAQIQAIQCNETQKGAALDIYFSTNNDAAKEYTRRPDTIPYDYGNQVNPYFGSQSGQMKLQNNPDHENGVIILADAWDENLLHSLRLVPTKTEGQFSGYLSGHIDVNGVWERLESYPLFCRVQ